MSKPSEIIVVNVSSAPGVLGGAMLAAQWHSWFMAKKIPLVLWRMWNKDEVVQLEALQVRNFISRIKFGALGRLLPRLAKKVFLTTEIARELHRVKPKIVHLQNPGPALEFEKIAKTAQKIGAKVVASTHGFQETFDPQYGFDKFYQKIGWSLLLKQPLHRSFKNVDAFLLGFPKQQDFLEKLGVPKHKMHLVPNGIDPIFDGVPTLPELQHVKQKFDLNSNSPVLLFIGNHTPNKGLGTLIKLASTLEIPATVIVGGRILDGEPAKWLDGVQVPPHVRIVFTDFLTVLEQRALYHVARVFVFPSISETLPLVILEAMAAGLPSVAFDTGGISYQLDDGAGFVVPVGDFGGYRNCVLKLLNDQDLHKKMAEASKKRQQEIFSWALLADKTIEIYRKLDKSV